MQRGCRKVRCGSDIGFKGAEIGFKGTEGYGVGMEQLRRKRYYM